MRHLHVTQLLPGEDIVGESLVWDDAANRLLWVDIVGKCIRSLAPSSGLQQRWRTPEFPTSIGLRTDGGSIVGLTRRVALWEFGAVFDTFAEMEPDLPDNRLNEGRVAPDGSFWVGTMQSNLAADGSPKAMSGKAGSYYRIGADRSVARLTREPFGISNTMIWLDDGRFITADTLDNQLYAYAVDPQTGGLGNRQPFGPQFPRGYPDGSCLDREGGIWTCRVAGGYCLTRSLADGTVDRVVELPCAWPTSCAFGGPGLKTLFITSARFTLSQAHLDANPCEGGLFSVDPGVAGLPEARFSYSRERWA